jgi:glycosyltransferase involved in cell wall biosynthesis
MQNCFSRIKTSNQSGLALTMSTQMPPPLVSIVVPVYNVEVYIQQCLDSVVSQTYPHLQIICVIDGSTDGSENIVRQFASNDERILVMTQHNQGLSAARNTGIAKASGEYIFFLDSDDWLETNAIEKLVNCALQEKVDIVSGNVINFDEETGLMNPYLKPKRRKLGRLLLTNLDFLNVEIMVFNKLYRRHIVINTPFQAGLIHEDIEFYWRIFSVHNLVFAIHDTVVYYRRRSGSLSNQKFYPENYQDNFIKIYDSIAPLISNRMELKYHFERTAIKNLESLQQKNAPHARYQEHIKAKYGINQNLWFRIKLGFIKLLLGLTQWRIKST